jgi:hypothetical protein
MFQRIGEAIDAFRFKRKIKAGGSLTPLEALKVASSPRLASEIESLGVPVVVHFPPNVLVRGLENLAFEGSVRIHSTRNMMISSASRLHINPKRVKRLQSMSAREIDAYDTAVLEEQRARETVVLGSDSGIGAVPCKQGDCGCPQ